MILTLLAFFTGFIGMEGAAWAAHKYLMHGPLWRLHRDHHVPGRGFFQANDWFFLLFAVPSALSIRIGLERGPAPLAAFGFGVLAFGLTYVVIHEILIHRRVRWFRSPRRGYLNAIVRRHRRHHQRATKEHGQYFGMLWAPPRDWR